MRSSKLLGTWTTIYILLRTGQAASLPHPSCSVTVPNLSNGDETPWMECVSNDLHIPDNFNVDLVSNNGSRFSLVLGNKSSTAVSNVISEGVRPIRAGLGLRSVFFYGFQSGDTWDRFETLLSNVKGELYQLHLQYCSIRRLPATFLRGYYALSSLSLITSELESLDLNAFDTRHAFGSQLSTILLTGNKLETFDWATFQPVADRLQTASLLYAPDEMTQYIAPPCTTSGFGVLAIRQTRMWSTAVDLSAQMPPLHTITNSKNTTIKELWHLNLNDNRLSFPMLQVIRLDSINLNSSYANLSWTLSNNNLCSSVPRCACCEARDFVTFARNLSDTFQFRTNNSNNKLEFTCGDSSDGSDSAWYVRHGLTLQPFLSGYHSARLPPPGLYECCTVGGCPNSANILSSRTVWAAVLFSTFALLRSA